MRRHDYAAFISAARPVVYVVVDDESLQPILIVDS